MLEKRTPEQSKADCLEKLNNMITKVEAGEVTEVIIHGVIAKKETSDILEIYTNIAMTRGHRIDIVKSQLEECIPELSLLLRLFSLR